MVSIAPKHFVLRKALNGPRAQYTIEKHPGLYLFADGKGGGSWRIRYRPYKGAAKRWVTLTNDARNVTFEEVSKQASELLSDLKVRGVDPRQARAVNASTFDKTFNDWLEAYAKVHKKSWKADEDLYQRHVRSRIGDELLERINRPRVTGVLDDVAKKATPIQANRCQSLISAVLSWAVDEGRIEIHPALRIRRRGEERSRDLVMTHDQLKVFWAEISRHFENAQIAMRLLTLVGCRLGELMLAKKAEVQIGTDDPHWLQPAENTKNALPHLVPLTEYACELFKQAFALNKDSPFVFPARRLVPAPLDGNQVSRQFKETARAIGVPDMRLHDLRHQAATGMAECGVPLEIRQMVQNQITGRRASIGARYDQYEYRAEKRGALEVWERRLLTIVNGEKPSTERYVL